MSFCAVRRLCPSSLSPSFFFHCHGDHPDLHSFPTRRSSDLCESTRPTHKAASSSVRRSGPRRSCPPGGGAGGRTRTGAITQERSEEHTSELQSLRHLVCRLLLEKKKKPKREKASNKHRRIHS